MSKALHSLLHSLERSDEEFSFVQQRQPVLSVASLAAQVLHDRQNINAPTASSSSTNPNISNVSPLRRSSVDGDQVALFHETVGAIRLTISVLSAYVKSQSNQEPSPAEEPATTTSRRHSISGSARTAAQQFKSLNNVKDLQSIIFQFVETLLHQSETIFYTFKHLQPPFDLNSLNTSTMDLNLLLHQLNETLHKTIQFCTTMTSSYQQMLSPASFSSASSKKVLNQFYNSISNDFHLLTSQLSNCSVKVTKYVDMIRRRNLKKNATQKNLEESVKRLEKKNGEIISVVREQSNQQEILLQKLLAKNQEEADSRNLRMIKDMRDMMSMLLKKQFSSAQPEASSASSSASSSTTTSSNMSTFVKENSIAREFAMMTLEQSRTTKVLKAKIKSFESRMTRATFTHFVGGDSIHAGKPFFTSISEAIAAANPGDVIIIREGIYNESLIIDKALTLVGASSPDRVVICSSELTSTIHIRGQEKTTEEIKIPKRSVNVVIAHLSIVQIAKNTEVFAEDKPTPAPKQASPKLASSITTTQAENRVVDQGNSAEGSKKGKQKNQQLTSEWKSVNSALMIDGNKVHALVENCLISGGIQSSVYVSNNGSLSLRGNKVYDSRGNGITTENGAKDDAKATETPSLTNEEPTLSCEVIIEDNEIIMNAGNGVAVVGGPNQVVIRNNRIKENEQDGVFIHTSSGSECLIENNIIHRNLDNGVQVSGEQSYAVLLNNQIYENVTKNGIYVKDGAEIHAEKNELMRNKMENICIEDFSSQEHSVLINNLEDADLDEFLQ